MATRSTTPPPDRSAGARLVAGVEAELIEPLRALGLDVEAVEITPAGNRRVLRVAVDQDGGISLDDLAVATRAVNAVLDASDVMGQQPYTLEVTSRGVDRPLTLARHWRRNTRRLVKLTLLDGTALTGRVTSVDDGPDSPDGPDSTVVLDVSGVEQRVRVADVAKALVQVEFNRPPEPEETEPDEPDDTDDTATTEEDD